MKKKFILLSNVLLLLTLTGCTTMQTTYFRGSFQQLESVSAPGFYPYSGESRFRMVADMSQGAEDMYNEGYAMIGYSQFVSPLFTNLAPSYATKYAQTLQAEYAVMETPKPGASNLHGYLVTYWSRVRPDAFGIGAYPQDLPDQLLDRLGRDYNVVYLVGVVPGTPAANAGLKRNDVVLAVNGRRVNSAASFVDRVRESWGEEAVISVSRYGKHLEIPVNVAEPAVSSTSFSLHDKPWQYTAPRDWSGLSAANIVADVQRQRVAEQQRQLAYERGRHDAMAAQAYAASDTSSAYSSFRSSGNRRQAISRADRQRGINPPSEEQWKGDYIGAMLKMQNVDDFAMKGDSLNMFFGNYSKIYGQYYTYPN